MLADGINDKRGIEHAIGRHEQRIRIEIGFEINLLVLFRILLEIPPVIEPDLGLDAMAHRYPVQGPLDLASMIRHRFPKWF
jgi:hypothetical protein